MLFRADSAFKFASSSVINPEEEGEGGGEREAKEEKEQFRPEEPPASRVIWRQRCAAWPHQRFLLFQNCAFPKWTLHRKWTRFMMNPPVVKLEQRTKATTKRVEKKFL
jgi:hypothetical protein